MPSPKLTPWKLAGTAGGSVAVGTPVARLAITGSYLYFPLQHQTTKQTIVLEAVGLGATVGVSAVPSPVHISGRLPNFPSAQLGSLIAGIRAPGKMTVKDIKTYSNILLASGNAAAGGQGGFNIALLMPDKFQSKNWSDWGLDVASCIISGVGGQPADLFLNARGICIWGSVTATTNALSAGLNFTQYRVLKHRVL